MSEATWEDIVKKAIEKCKKCEAGKEIAKLKAKVEQLEENIHNAEFHREKE